MTVVECTSEKMIVCVVLYFILFCYGFSWLQVLGTNSQKLTLDPNVTVIEGNNATLTCKIIGDNLLLYYLKIRSANNGLAIIERGRECRFFSACDRCIVTCDFPSSTFIFTLTDVTFADNNTAYEFWLYTYSRSSSYKKKATIYVKEACANVVLEANGNITLNRNKAVSLFCEAKCSPTAHIKWHAIKQEGNSPMVIGSGEDFVYSYKQGNATVYCTATNGRSTRKESNRTSIQVIYKPYGMYFKYKQNQIDEKTDLKINEISDLNVTCMADCSPPCYYDWEHSHTEVATTSELIITDIKRTETGNYTCTASNNLGNLSKTIYIDVLYASKINDTQFPSDTVVIHEDQSSSFNCIVEGNPKPDILWFRNDNLFEKSFSNAQTYTITNATCNDTGQYMCLGSNDIGFDIKQISLYVKCKPRITMPKAKTIFKDSLDNLTLSVYYNAYPPPNTTLYFHSYHHTNQSEDITDSGMVIVNHTFWHVARISINNRNENASGRYQLEIRNDLGVDFLEIVEKAKETKKESAVVLVSVITMVTVAFLLLSLLIIYSFSRLKKSKKEGQQMNRHDGAVENERIYENDGRVIELAAELPYQDLEPQEEIEEVELVEESPYAEVENTVPVYLEMVHYLRPVNVQTRQNTENADTASYVQFDPDPTLQLDK